jgi:hypothetical protein
MKTVYSVRVKSRTWSAIDRWLLILPVFLVSLVAAFSRRMKQVVQRNYSYRIVRRYSMWIAGEFFRCRLMAALWLWETRHRNHFCLILIPSHRGGASKQPDFVEI